MHVCIYIHIHNKYTQYTHILCEQKLILFAINRLTALNIEREREREREREKERVRKRERERFPSENTILLLFYYILYYKHGNSFSEKQHGCRPIVLKTYEFDWQPTNSLRSLVKEIKRQFFSLPKATCNLFRSPALVSQQASLPNQATQDNHNFKPSLLLARFLCQINAAEKLVLFLSFNNDNILISSLI